MGETSLSGLAFQQPIRGHATNSQHFAAKLPLLEVIFKVPART